MRSGARTWHRVVVACGVLAGAVAIAGPPPVATHFSHAEHTERSAHVDQCETCHAVDARGKVAPPASLGHSPCQSAKCHATYFLAITDKVRKSDPARYAKAAAFCLGCHDSKDGAPPTPWSKPATNAALQSFQYEREYHVEMNHFEHTTRADCRTCHVVDDKTFALVPSTPGHGQCVACHNAEKFPQFTMSKCGLCHDKPARADYFEGSRPKIDVRACGGEGHAALEKKLGHAVSCFRHERVEHRTVDGKALSCATCHYMVGNKKLWGSRRYQTLRDLHVATIIDNSKDREHESCGRTAACHKADLDTVRGTSKCSLCHAEISSF